MSTKIKSVLALIVILNVWMANSSFMMGTEKANSATFQLTLRQDKRTQIKSEELPEPVKKTIDEKFKGWTIAKAFEVVKASSAEYEVELSMNNETKTVKLDKEGNIKQ